MSVTELPAADTFRNKAIRNQHIHIRLLLSLPSVDNEERIVTNMMYGFTVRNIFHCDCSMFFDIL